MTEIGRVTFDRHDAFTTRHCPPLPCCSVRSAFDLSSFTFCHVFAIVPKCVVEVQVPLEGCEAEFMREKLQRSRRAALWSMWWALPNPGGPFPSLGEESCPFVMFPTEDLISFLTAIRPTTLKQIHIPL